MDLNVFKWVDKVLKSLHSKSFGKRSIVRCRSWKLLLENAELNFKYTVFLFELWFALILEKLQNKDIQKKIKKAHVSIIYLDVTLLFDFSLEQELRLSNRGIIPYIISHIPRGSVFKMEDWGKVNC